MMAKKFDLFLRALVLTALLVGTLPVKSAQAGTPAPHLQKSTLPTAQSLNNAISVAAVPTFEGLPAVENCRPLPANFSGEVVTSTFETSSQLTTAAPGMQVVPEAKRTVITNGVDQWLSTTALPGSRQNHGIAVSRGRLFIFAGDDHQGRILSTVFSTPINTQSNNIDEWSAAPSLAKARTEAAYGASESVLYAAGGFDGTQVLSSVEYAVVQTNGSIASWNAGSPLNVPRRGAAGVVANGYFYVIGGTDANGAALQSIEYAAINTSGAPGAFTVASTHLLTGRKNAAAVFAPGPGMGYLYILGGSSGSAPLDSVEKAYQNPNGSLGPISLAVQLGYARESLAAAFFMGYVFAFGGRAGGSQLPTSSVEFAPVLMDGSGDLAAWQPTASLLSNRSGLGVAVSNTHVYAAGGWTDTGFANISEYSLIRGSLVVPPPHVYQVSPSGGISTAETTITITGDTFIEKPQVQVGSTLVSQVTYIGPGSVSAVVPRGIPPGRYDIVVINPDGQSDVLPASYTVSDSQVPTTPPPTLTQVQPSSASNTASTEMTLTGTNFLAGIQVYLDDLQLKNVIFDSPTRVRATVLPGTPPRVYTVQVRNPDGQQAQLNGAFTLSVSNSYWSLRQARMTQRTAGSAAVINNTLYTVAGLDLNKFGRLVEVYDPAADRWSNRMDFPATGGRILTSGAVFNGRLYIFGGMNITNGQAAAEAYVFDPTSGYWQSILSYPLKEFAAPAVESGGKIYIFGGEQAGVPVTDNFLALGNSLQQLAVYAYDPASNTYAGRARAPKPTSAASAVTLNGVIYLIGGWQQGQASASVQVYNPLTDQWTAGPSLPQPRAEASAVVLNGKILLLGGHDGQTVYNTVYELDPNTSSWTERPPMTTPRAGAFAGVINNKVYVAGGRSLLRSGLLSSVEEGNLAGPAGTPQLFVSQVAHNFGEAESAWQFDIRNVGSGSLTWEIQKPPDSDWLIVEPSSGSQSQTIQVSVKRDGKMPGSYQAQLSIVSNGGSALVDLSMQVVLPPQIKTEPSAVTFNITDNVLPLQISNLGGGALAWQIAADVSWINPVPASGSGNTTVQLNLNRGQLPAEENTTTLHITSNGGQIELPVTAYKGSSPILDVTPPSLNLGPTKNRETLQVTVNGSGILDWQASSDSGWLVVEPGSGQNSGTVNVAVSREGFPPGELTGNITFRAGDQEKIIPVSITVPEPVVITLDKTVLPFGTQSNQDSFTITVTGGEAAWMVVENLDWINVSPLQGKTTQAIMVTVNRAGKTPGDYTGTISIDNAAGAKSIDVSMTVEQGPILTISPPSIDFGRVEMQRDLQITNSGAGALSWSISGKPTWLTLSQASGSTGGGQSSPVQLTLVRSSLDVGQNHAVLTINGGAGGSKTIAVDAYKDLEPQLDVTPTRIDFGSTDSSRLLYIKNTGGGTLSWSITSSKTWLKTSVRSGTGNTVVSVTIDRPVMPSGSNEATLTVTGAGTSRTVTVLAQVNPPVITQLTIGNVTVYANTFTLVSSGKYHATGSIRLNSKFTLTGTSDYVDLDTNAKTVSGYGTVTFNTGGGSKKIFTDKFTVSVNDAILTPVVSTVFTFLQTNIASFKPVSVFDVQAFLSPGAEQLTVKIKVALRVPPSFQQEYTLNVTFNVDGTISGNLGTTQTIVVKVGGLSLSFNNLGIGTDGLSATSVMLSFPESLGGLTTKILKITFTASAPYISMGGAEVSVSNIRFGGPGGFTIKTAKLGFYSGANGVEWYGKGKFTFNAFTGGCEIDIEFKIVSLTNWSGSFSITCMPGYLLGNTGLWLTGLQGGASFGDKSFSLNLGVTIAGGPYIPSPFKAYLVSGTPVLKYAVTDTSFSLGLEGSLKIFKWDVANSSLTYKKVGTYESVIGSVTITMKFLTGGVSLEFWKDTAGVHYKGCGKVKLFIPAGSILYTTLVKVPPADWPVSEINVCFGEYKKKDGTIIYGGKGQINIGLITYAFFIDAYGNFSGAGDIVLAVVSLASRKSVSLAFAESMLLPESIVVNETPAASFILGWDSGSPRLRLTDPDGRVIDENSADQNVVVTYQGSQQVISILHPKPGTWTTEVYNLEGNLNNEVVLVTQNNAPTVEILTPETAEEGSQGYLIQWTAQDIDDAGAKVSLYYDLASGGPTTLIAKDLPLSETSFFWDTAAVPTGEYKIHAVVDDQSNVPQEDVSTGTVLVRNLDAPPAPALTVFQAQNANGRVLINWTPVSAPDLQAYRIYISYGGGLDDTIIEVKDQTSADIYCIIPNRQFSLHVTALDSSGNESPFSNQVSGMLLSNFIFMPALRR